MRITTATFIFLSNRHDYIRKRLLIQVGGDVSSSNMKQTLHYKQLPFAFVCEVDCFYTVTDSSADSDGWWEQAVQKLPQKQTQTQLLEVKSEVYRDTDREKTNSYQFYSCLQTATERKERRSNESL